MVIINLFNKNTLIKTAEVFNAGGIIIFPTDTVYGIGCLINNKAIKKLYKIKNRPLNKPTAILLTQKIYYKICSSRKHSINIPEKIEKEFFSGKTTLVFPEEYFSLNIPIVLVKDEQVAIRLPKDKWLEKLINLTGPIVASSANLSGEKTPVKFSDLSSTIIEKVDLVLKTSKKSSGKPSSIYDLKKMAYLRN